MPTTQPIDLPERTGLGPDAEEAALTFVGTATILVRIAGFTVLTDPNVPHDGEHASLDHGLWSRRRAEPALPPDHLPRLDFVVLSRHHGDHVDERIAEMLDERVPIITTPHASRKFRRQGFHEARGLRTWDAQVVTRGLASVKVTALPGHHGRRPIDVFRPSVMGSLLEFRRPGVPPFNLYITGDPLVHDRLREVAQRHPSIRLSLLYVGGTRVAGALLSMDAAESVGSPRLTRPERGDLDLRDSYRFSLVH